MEKVLYFHKKKTGQNAAYLLFFQDKYLYE